MDSSFQHIVEPDLRDFCREDCRGWLKTYDGPSEVLAMVVIKGSWLEPQDSLFLAIHRSKAKHAKTNYS